MRYWLFALLAWLALGAPVLAIRTPTPTPEMARTPNAEELALGRRLGFSDVEVYRLFRVCG